MLWFTAHLSGRGPEFPDGKRRYNASVRRQVGNRRTQFMVFSSEFFLFYFLPCALAVYYLARGRGRNLVLTLVSYLF